jgi:hypothetical protein
MTLTTIQNLKENHTRISNVLRGIDGIIGTDVTYSIMDPNESPFVTIRVMKDLSEKDTKIRYDNAMSIQSITSRQLGSISNILLDIKLSYSFANPFTYNQAHESKYLYIKDGESCDVVFLKYSETRVGDAFPSDYPGNKDQIYNVNFVVVNLSNGDQQQIWTVDPSFQEEILGAIQKFGPKLNVRRVGREPQNTRYYFEQIPLEYASPAEVV